MDTAQSTLSKQTLIDDFRTEISGRLPEGIIESTVSFVETAGGSYPAVLKNEYGKLTCKITDGQTFTSGSFTSQVLNSNGYVYTNDLSALYANTVSFTFISTPVYVALYFYDNKSAILGYFQGSTISVTIGSGGGEGSWS